MLKQIKDFIKLFLYDNFYSLIKDKIEVKELFYFSNLMMIENKVTFFYINPINTKFFDFNNENNIYITGFGYDKENENFILKITGKKEVYGIDIYTKEYWWSNHNEKIDYHLSLKNENKKFGEGVYDWFYIIKIKEGFHFESYINSIFKNKFCKLRISCFILK